MCEVFFFFNDTATTEIYTLSLHDALPIWNRLGRTIHSTTLTGGHTPPQLGQRGGWNGVRHGHRGIITHHKWPQVFRVTAVLDKSDLVNKIDPKAPAFYLGNGTQSMGVQQYLLARAAAGF